MTRRIIMIVLFSLAAIGGVFSLAGCHREEFTGERTKNPDAYILDIRYMNGTDRHTLSLTAGDVLQVGFETEKGDLRLTITAPDGTTLYDGNGKEATSFTVNIRESGNYAVTTQARRARGRIDIRLKGAAG